MNGSQETEDGKNREEYGKIRIKTNAKKQVWNYSACLVTARPVSDSSLTIQWVAWAKHRLQRNWNIVSWHGDMPALCSDVSAYVQAACL